MKMVRRFRFIKDESGIETLEWIAIGVLILVVAFALYPGILQSSLSTVVSNVGSALTTSSSGLTGS